MFAELTYLRFFEHVQHLLSSFALNMSWDIRYPAPSTRTGVGLYVYLYHVAILYQLYSITIAYAILCAVKADG